LSSNLGPILHRLATIRPLYTDGRTNDNACRRHLQRISGAS